MGLGIGSGFRVRAGIRDRALTLTCSTHAALGAGNATPPSSHMVPRVSVKARVRVRVRVKVRVRVSVRVRVRVRVRIWK